jgi:hypothetical protein
MPSSTPTAAPAVNATGSDERAGRAVAGGVGTSGPYVPLLASTTCGAR